MSVSCTDLGYKASNVWIMANDELGSIWKKSIGNIPEFASRNIKTSFSIAASQWKIESVTCHIRSRKLTT
jgi:hypothetical protein